VIAGLAVSGVCCIIAAVTSHINNKNLADHMKSIGKAA
jgi:prolyl-tRNA editing enzyme YbaK/EbsC (Cys-tRNA(Pro) deacylase)